MTESSAQIPRRSLLIGAAASAAVVGAGALTPGAVTAATPATSRRGRSTENPFQMGVASGDPLPESVILWTRLAPKPLDLDGGMPPTDQEVEWEIATDESFSNVVQSGVAAAPATYGHSVHVDVQGLTPDSWYYYRFKHNGHITETARTRTTPALGAAVAPFTFGQASCGNWQSGHYQLYADLVTQDLDYWIHLGDYLYEYGAYDPKRPDKGGYVRDDKVAHRPIPWGKEPVNLPQYRRQYGLYRSDPDLQALHAAAPYSVIWDDHEVDNNFTRRKSGGDGQRDRVEFRRRRAAGFRAFWENHALRVPPTDGRRMRIYRRIDWGTTATFLFLDGRQYRSDQPGKATSDFGGWDEGMFNPDSTMLGKVQEDWLSQQLADSSAKWTFIAQQTVFSDVNGGAAFDNPALLGLTRGLYNYDAWDGYWAARGRLVDAILANQVRNPVVLTGDFHTNLAFDLLSSWPDPRDYPTAADLTTAIKGWEGTKIGTELCCGAVSSPTFFGSGIVAAAGPGTLRNTPWAAYGELQNNGVIVNRVSSESVEAEYRIAKTNYKRNTPEGRPRTDKTIVIEDGVPGVAGMR